MFKLKALETSDYAEYTQTDWELTAGVSFCSLDNNFVNNSSRRRIVTFNLHHPFILPLHFLIIIMLGSYTKNKTCKVYT